LNRLVIAVGAGICGLIAARYWYKSSLVEYGPDWDFEPVAEESINMGQFAAIMKAAKESSNLNKFAARWTAVAVVLTNISSIASARGEGKFSGLRISFLFSGGALSFWVAENLCDGLMTLWR
jgi:hypothetical protein